MLLVTIALALLNSGLLFPAAAATPAGRTQIVIDWVAKVPANQQSIQNVLIY
jgi:hypothetical protein